MKVLKYILPVVAIAVGIAGLVALKAAQVKVQTQTPEKQIARVSVVIVKPQMFEHEVRTNGTVTPRTETTLSSETAGRVVGIHESFVNGGFFKKDEVLVTLDDTAQKAALAQAQAALAGAKAALQREEAESALAKREWEKYGEGEPDALVLREPQLAERKAGVLSAEAAVTKADLDLKRTKVLAPYDGRVRQKQIEEGQYATPGAPLARVYATDFTEVRLPISADDIGYLNLPLGGVIAFDDEQAPKVDLSADFGRETYVWSARIVRTEAEVDPQTRMYYAVARVKDPFGTTQPIPLLPNTFVSAVITGREVEQVFVVPRRALRPDGRVLIVDKQSRIKHREVVVSRTTPESVLVIEGLESGERVVVTDLDLVVEDMPVEVVKGAVQKETP
ncbi:MAG: efflux RND transporter periplasmic adaptor subunit [Planctomycetota bacterium]